MWICEDDENMSVKEEDGMCWQMETHLLTVLVLVPALEHLQPLAGPLHLCLFMLPGKQEKTCKPLPLVKFYLKLRLCEGGSFWTPWELNRKLLCSQVDWSWWAALVKDSFHQLCFWFSQPFWWCKSIRLPLTVNTKIFISWVSATIKYEVVIAKE